MQWQPPVVERAVVLEVQSILIEAGFDNVEIAQCFTESGRITGGYDFWLDVSSVGRVSGFRERLELHTASLVIPSYRFSFILSDKSYTITRDEISAKLLKVEPISTALEVIKECELARTAVT